MFRSMAAAAAAAAVLGAAGSAQAGVFADDLARCVVTKSSPQDQTVFMMWVFSAISAHPTARPYANITEAQRDALNAKAAEVMQRLLTVDCRAEAVAGIKHEGTDAIEKAFATFGESAMSGIMTDPQVAGVLGGIEKHMDAAKFEALGAEAGVQ